VLPALLAPLVLQAAAMLYDEGVCHRRRKLPRWERIGHPLDTLSFASCFAWLAFSRPTSTNAWPYAGLAALSTLLVTKDEWVHARLCSPQEHWIHAVLFGLHPVVLIAAGVLWWNGQLRRVLVAELVTLTAFGTFQLAYWNGPWSRARREA
jgi:hypothetical protein